MRMSLHVAALVLVAGVTPVMAQQHQHKTTPPPAGEHQMPAGMMMGQGMNMGMGPLTRDLGPYAPSRLLGMADTLRLSAEQVNHLTTLATESKAAEENAHAPAHAAMQQLRKVLAVDSPDIPTLQALFQAHHTAMGNVQWVRAEAALKAREMLTAEQRGRVGNRE